MTADQPQHVDRPEGAVVVDGAEGAVVVDALGKLCPVPVIELAKAMQAAEVGEVLVVLADDPGAKVDIPVWCRMKRQELVAVENADRGWRFRVRRLS